MGLLLSCDGARGTAAVESASPSDEAQDERGEHDSEADASPAGDEASASDGDGDASHGEGNDVEGSDGESAVDEDSAVDESDREEDPLPAPTEPDASASRDQDASEPSAPVSDAAVPNDGEAEPEPPDVVRFVVLGDGGTGDEHQRTVAQAIKRVCDELGCEFALYAGDNIYESGVADIDDAQFESKFESPYAELDFPFFVALGNHDYGSSGNNIFPDDNRSSAQVEYTAHSDKWTMPHHYYTFRRGALQFYAIDTNAIILDRYRTLAEQQSWLDSAIEASDAPWKFVFGHHPYLSNGQHGNATNSDLRALIEGSVCGRAQVYFAGHDHNREWLEPSCGSSFIVSGAAAKLRDMRGEEQPTRYQDGKKRGFLWVEVSGDLMLGRFYDDAGELDYEDMILR